MTDLRHHKSLFAVSWQRRCAGWLVHIFTASGAYIGLLALFAIYEHKLLLAFWLMGGAIIIDAVDGLFARKIKIKIAVPEIDGALLDNIVDFLNYTIVPAFFLLIVPIIPISWKFICILFIILSSAYQFTHVEAKTQDHFFKGFPSYWNIVIFYLFFWQMNPWVNLSILLILALLSFIPIKYIYPTRMENLSHHKILRLSMLLATLFWGGATASMLWQYPKANHILVLLSMGYVVLYFIISLYRTWAPLPARTH